MTATVNPIKPFAVAGGAMAAAAVVAAVPPQGQAFYPPCPFHAMTGLWCPMCGSTRALHALLTGHLTQALHDNVLLLAALPVIVVLWFSWIRPLRLTRSLRWTPATTALLIAVVAAYGVARNLPWLHVLAPVSVRG